MISENLVAQMGKTNGNGGYTTFKYMVGAMSTVIPLGTVGIVNIEGTMLMVETLGMLCAQWACWVQFTQWES